MSNDYKVLAQVQLGTSVANVYAPAAGVKAIVKAISIENVDSVERNAYLYVNGTANANRIFKQAIPADDGIDGDGTLTLNGDDGDTLKGKAAAAAVVNVTVFGVEVTS